MRAWLFFPGWKIIVPYSSDEGIVIDHLQAKQLPDKMEFPASTMSKARSGVKKRQLQPQIKMRN